MNRMPREDVPVNQDHGAATAHVLFPVALRSAWLGAALLAAAVFGGTGWPSPLVAQAPDELEGSRPGGWEVLTDELGADTTAITFVAMEPGFHLTTGPAALFYDRGNTARGTYRAEASIHLFAPEGDVGGFGLFVGGDDLDGSYQTYTALLLRASGEFSVVRQLSFTSSETLLDWTDHEAVLGWADRSTDAQTVENALAIEVGEDEMVFFVNGREVGRTPRTSQGAEGIAGLRVEDGVNLHITGFGIEPL